VVSSSGVWLPAADLLTTGYSWSNAYEMNMTMNLPGGAGQGTGNLTVSQSSSVAGTEPVSFSGGTFDGLQIAQESTQTMAFSFGGFSSPGQPISSSSTYVLVRGIGIVRFESSGEGFSSTSTLVSYSIP
jgi:hypothetical protein